MAQSEILETAVEKIFMSRLQAFGRRIDQLQTELGECRRSRQRRCRLILKARKARLGHCLRKLRTKGMTVEEGPRPWFIYDHRTCDFHRDRIVNEIEELCALRRRMILECPATILANLRAMEDDAKMIIDAPCKFQWIMNDVWLEDVMIGSLRVSVNLECFDVEVENLTVNMDEKAGYPHPHVARDGRVCWNGYDDEARLWHQSGQFVALRDLIENLLHTYNPNSPYITLEDWEYDGSTCASCGEHCHEDDLSWSESYEGDLCNTCGAWCSHCDCFVHVNGYDSQMEACLNCVSDETSPCEGCGEMFWNDDLLPYEIPTFDELKTILLCQDCHDVYESKALEEEINIEENSNECTAAIS